MRHTLAIATAIALAACAMTLVANQNPPDQAHQSDEAVDLSIQRGLAWLAESQNADGTFGKHGPNDVTGIWALCAMSFLARGHIPGSDRYGAVVERTAAKLLSVQRDDGYLGGNNGKMYSHCIVTLFLSEISGMVNPDLQAKINIVLPKAVKLILDAQKIEKNDHHRGGWRYEPNSTDSDFSCSGWALMALRSARLNGAQVPPEAISEAVSYILKRHDENLGSFGYTDTHTHGITLTGAGILCLSLCGEHENPAVQRGARFLMQKYTELPKQGYCFYGVYYAAQGLFQLGGSEWQSYSRWMYDTWIPQQHEDGYWDRNENDRHYQTAMVLLAFTVPYRQLPIYQRDETVDETSL